jgi:hypothetical protein
MYSGRSSDRSERFGRRARGKTQKRDSSVRRIIGARKEHEHEPAERIHRSPVRYDPVRRDPDVEEADHSRNSLRLRDQRVRLCGAQTSRVRGTESRPEAEKPLQGLFPGSSFHRLSTTRSNANRIRLRPFPPGAGQGPVLRALSNSIVETRTVRISFGEPGCRDALGSRIGTTVESVDVRDSDRIELRLGPEAQDSARSREQNGPRMGSLHAGSRYCQTCGLSRIRRRSSGLPFARCHRRTERHPEPLLQGARRESFASASRPCRAACTP